MIRFTPSPARILGVPLASMEACMRTLLLYLALAVLDVGAQSPPRPPSVRTDRTEVIFIGANHAYAFLRPGFLPADIRALLTKIAPVALCVENDRDWPAADGIPTYPHEQYASLTWARANGVPVAHVNWDDANFKRARSDTVSRMDYTALHATAPAFGRFQAGYIARMQFSAQLAFREYGSDLTGFHAHELPALLRELPADDDYASVRNDSIAARIRLVIDRHRGRRIALVIGGGHYRALKERLERDPGVRVSLPSRFLPIAPEESARSWQEDDAIVLLGTNLDDWRIIATPHARNHALTRELLDRLIAARPSSAVTQYYQARWRMLFSDTDSARHLLKRVVVSPERTALPYRADQRWAWPPFRSYQQKALFQLATLEDAAGRRDSALVHYRALLALSDDELVVPMGKWRHVDLRPFIQSFLRMPYSGGMLEAYRAEMAMGMIR